MTLNVIRRGLLGLSFLLLLLVGIAHTSAAKPPLGRNGWAPPSMTWGPSAGQVTVMLFVAYCAGALALLLALWRPSTRAFSWALPGLLGAAALLTGPFGSGDHTNYAAYGRIAVHGDDPYSVAPAHWHGGLDPITAAVQQPWRDTPSVYGPIATALQAVASWIGGDNLRETVWVWQIFMVASWLGVRYLLRQLAQSDDTRSRIDVLWTFNPIVFGVMLLGAHVDLLATLFVVGALVFARRQPVVAGLFVGAALSTKLTYGVVLLPIVWAWRELDRREGTATLRERSLRALGGLLAIVIPSYVVAGPHALSQLAGAGGTFSLASPWSLVVSLLRHFLPDWSVRTIVVLCAAAAMLAIASGIIRIVEWFDLASELEDDVTRWSIVGTFALFTAYVLAAPYSLPWYDAPTWALLPLIGAFVWDAVLVVRHLFMALAYVPGRVDISPSVENWTLGFRRGVTPWVCWVVLALFAFWEVGVTRARRFRLR